MSPPTDLQPALAYTSEAIETYLDEVATERTGLFEGIAGAEARGARAAALEQRIVALERQAGEAMVNSSARAWARRRDLEATSESVPEPAAAEAAPTEAAAGSGPAEPDWQEMLGHA